jgi:hypothetical protein
VAFVTGLFSLAATVPTTIVALVDPHGAPAVAPAAAATDCPTIDRKALQFLDAHPALRTIYAKSGDAATQPWHLGPLATAAQQEACRNPERLVEAEQCLTSQPQPSRVMPADCP